MYTGFLNSLTSTAKIADCPGVCVHALATLMCDDVLEDVQCPATSMRCCLQDPINGTESSSENVIDYEGPISAVSITTMKNTMISTTTPATTTMLDTSTSSTSVKIILVYSTDFMFENNWVDMQKTVVKSYC